MILFLTSVMLLFLLIFRGIPCSQVFNRSVPIDLFSFEYVQQDTMNGGCKLAELFKIIVNLLGQEMKTVEAQKLDLKQWDNGRV